LVVSLLLAWGIVTAIDIKPEVLGIGILTLIPATIACILSIYLLSLRGFAPFMKIVPTLRNTLLSSSNNPVTPTAIALLNGTNTRKYSCTQITTSIINGISSFFRTILYYILPTTDIPMLSLLIAIGCITAYELSVIFTGIGTAHITINNNIKTITYTTEYSYLATSWLFLTLNCLAMIGVVHTLLQHHHDYKHNRLLR